MMKLPPIPHQRQNSPIMNQAVVGEANQSMLSPKKELIHPDW